MVNWLWPLPARNWPKKILIIGNTFLFLVIPNHCFSHHAKEWLIIESYDTTHEGEAVSLNSFDYFKPDTGHPSEDHWEFTPTLLYGITDHLMLDLHVHLTDKPGVDPFVEAGTVGLQYRLLERRELPIDLGFSMSYEYPTSRGQDVLDGTDLLTLTTIMSKKINRWVDVTGNLSYEQELDLGNASEANWKLGAKGPVIFPLRRWLTGGLEFQGNFNFGTDPEIEAVPGVHMHLKRETVLKLGIGAGLTEEADDVSFRVTFLHGFGKAFKNVFNRKEKRR
jgi:hypothetical protein